MSYAGFVADIAARHPVANVRFAVEVYGLPYVFTSSELNSTAFTSLFGSNRTQLKVLLGDSVEIGQYRLDTKQRRVTSATARFSVVLDAGGIVQSLITPRAKPIARLKENLTTSETAADVTLTSRTVSNTPLYVGGETMRATAWSGGTITVARGQYGTTAQEHFGGSNGIGTDIYASPQAWANRRVTVWAYLVDEHNASPTSSAYYGDIYRGRLMSVPQFDSGLWSFEIEHDSERIANTECGLGLREINLQPELQSQEFDNWRKFYLPATDLALFASVSSEHSLAVVTGSDETVPCTVVDVGVDYVEISSPLVARATEIYAAPFESVQASVDVRRSFASCNAKSIRHACRLRGDPAEVALTLLSSNLGTQAYTDADVLPGTVRTTYGGAQFRFGAGLPESNVLEATFTALMGRSPVPWDVLIDRPIKVSQILQELCAVLGLFWYLDADGLIAFGEMSDRDYASASSLAITKQTTVLRVPPIVTTEQGPALSSVTFRGAWDALIGKHLANVESIDWEIKNQFGESADAITIEANLASVNVANVTPEAQLRGALRRTTGVDLASVESVARRMQRESILSRQFVDVTLPIKFLSVAIGDIVTYTDDRLPDGEGGTLSAAVCRCVGYEADWSTGVVALQLLVTRPGWRFSPSALITANGGGAAPVLTLSTTWDGETSPGLNFPANSYVNVCNCTTGSAETIKVRSCTATTVTLDNAFASFTFTAGVSFVWLQSDGVTPEGYDTDTDFAVMCDDDANNGDAAYSEWG